MDQEYETSRAMTDDQFVQWLSDQEWSCDDWVACNGKLIHKPTGRVIDVEKSINYRFESDSGYSYRATFDGFRFAISERTYTLANNMKNQKLTQPEEVV